jgi:hypothetical protein
MILEYITYHFHFHFPACLCLTYLPTGRCEQKQKCWLRLAYSLIQLRRRLQGSVDLIKCAGGRAVDAISKPDAVVLSEKGRDVIYTTARIRPMSPQQPITCELSSNRWLQWLISVSTIEMNQWSCSSILGSRAWANFRLQPALPCFDTCRACLPTSASYPTKASTVKRFIFLVSCFCVTLYRNWYSGN